MLKEIKNNPALAQFKARHPNLNAIVIVIGIIMLWRGTWGLLDTYLFPGSPTLSYIVSIALGILVLYLDNFRVENLKR
ncbi:MAG: hypothetical protein ACU841_13200 [Gammaproteobacteria bacterium]